MKTIYLFDVDGTLTPAKSRMDKTFAKEFQEWQEDKLVYIVSGGSFPRIIEQLGSDIVENVQGVFACMGNVYYKRRKEEREWTLVYENKFKVLSRKVFFKDLTDIINRSSYHTKTGRHYEERTGMVNLSVVGRNADQEQRSAYEEYDAGLKEREKIVIKLSSRYPELDFVVGGAVSIDIFNRGNDKSQVVTRVLKDELENRRVKFFGDRTYFPGNDYSLAEILRNHPNGEVIAVETWEDTQRWIKEQQCQEKKEAS